MNAKGDLNKFKTAVKAATLEYVNSNDLKEFVRIITV